MNFIQSVKSLKYSVNHSEIRVLCGAPQNTFITVLPFVVFSKLFSHQALAKERLVNSTVVPKSLLSSSQCQWHPYYTLLHADLIVVRNITCIKKSNSEPPS